MEVHQQAVLWLFALSFVAGVSWVLYPFVVPEKEPIFYRGQMVKMSAFGNKAQIVGVGCFPDECFYRIRLSNADVKAGVREFELTAD
jgi:hypothetical protein